MCIATRRARLEAREAGFLVYTYWRQIYKTEQKSCINIYLLEPLDKQPVESPADSVLF